MDIANKEEVEELGTERSQKFLTSPKQKENNKKREIKPGQTIKLKKYYI